jgi:two-component system phosphate regulon response regulator OmpR
MGPDAPSRDAHLLVIDDDDRIRSLLKKFLSAQGYRVSAAGDAAQARALMGSLDFDLLILDVMMPGESGLDLTAAIRAKSRLPILLLTARGLPEDRIDGLRRGADDYLAKPFEPEELLLRVDNILRRAEPSAAAGPVTFGACRFDPARGELTRNGDVVRLTSAEAALLAALAARPGKAIPRADLAGGAFAGQERSVDVQVTRLRRKIEDDPRQPVHLQTVRGAGYKLVADPVSS